MWRVVPTFRSSSKCCFNLKITSHSFVKWIPFLRRNWIHFRFFYSVLKKIVIEQYFQKHKYIERKSLESFSRESLKNSKIITAIIPVQSYHRNPGWIFTRIPCAMPEKVLGKNVHKTTWEKSWNRSEMPERIPEEILGRIAKIIHGRIPGAFSVIVSKWDPGSIFREVSKEFQKDSLAEILKISANFEKSVWSISGRISGRILGRKTL